MKNNLTIVLLCASALLVALILWHGSREKESTPHSLAQMPNTNVSSTQNVVAPRAEMQQKDTNTGASTTAGTPESSQTNSVAAEERLRSFVENKNVPINFWGAVVDQDGNPLEGVKISGKIRTWYLTKTLNFDSRFPEVSALSGSGGKFQIRDASGDMITMKSMEKEGYEPEPAALRGFGYNTSERFSSDPNNPIVFKMWRTNIHEQLIVGDERFHVIPDGRAYVIDLAKGTIAESAGGDLKVWIKYPEQVARGQLYDWLSEIVVIDGGILEETDPYSSMFSAPVGGYISSFQYNQQIKGGQRGSTGSHRFYLSLQNGQKYGRITIEIRAPYNNDIPGLVHIQYAINPSGSHVLR
jgi:hypothetical protein